MAIKVPSAATVTTKWQTRAVSASGDYKTGVSGAGSDWQAGVDGAENNWASGVGSAAANHSYSRGVAGKASTYVDMATNIGASRYGTGVQAATNKYNTAIGKVLGVISAISLPPRTATGTNGARVEAVDTALHQAKLNGTI